MAASSTRKSGSLRMSRRSTAHLRRVGRRERWNPVNPRHRGPPFFPDQIGRCIDRHAWFPACRRCLLVGPTITVERLKPKPLPAMKRWWRGRMRFMPLRTPVSSRTATRSSMLRSPANGFRQRSSCLGETASRAPLRAISAANAENHPPIGRMPMVACSDRECLTVTWANDGVSQPPHAHSCGVSARVL